jgi:hypothetical protein
MAGFYLGLDVVAVLVTCICFWVYSFAKVDAFYTEHKEESLY